jgi:hypothetical protein
MPLFQIELAAFERSRAALLAQHAGRFAAFLGEELVCVADTAHEALKTAFLRTHAGAIFVEQITPERPVTRLPVLVAAG